MNSFKINTGGSDPAWPSNSEVSFFNRSNRFVIVEAKRPVGGGDAPEKLGFVPGVPTPAATRNNYAWDSTGRRVLMNLPVTQPDAVRIHVIVPRRSSGR